jgi:hypothetical protein
MSKLFVRDRSGIRQVSIDRLMTIGRGGDNDLVLSASYASRRHAWVWRQGDEVILEDLGSTYGTLVNGERVQEPRFLRHNDVIQMGEAQLTFVAQQDLSTAQTPPKGLPQIPLEQAFCTFCGALNAPGARYCAHCGYTLELPGSGDQDDQATMRGQPITPLEPIVARSFPAAGVQAQRGAGPEVSMGRFDSRTWALVLSLAIVAVILVTIVAVLLVILLG